jgi:hypothetical protein
VGLGGLGEGQEMVGVPLPRGADLAALIESLAGVLSDRLEQLVARRARPLPHHHQGAIHEAGEQVEDLVGREPLIGADGLGGLEGPAAGEDREASEQHLLRLRQEVVAPVDGRAQRTMAGQRSAPAGSQQRERVVQRSR